MNTTARFRDSQSKSGTSSVTELKGVPWLELRTRIKAGLAQRSFYLASSEDLSLLWQGERIDATERRRRISVFAAQYQWRAESRADGTAARFQPAPASGLLSREILSRNHE